MFPQAADLLLSMGKQTTINDFSTHFTSNMFPDAKGKKECAIEQLSILKLPIVQLSSRLEIWEHVPEVSTMVKDISAV